MKRFLYTLLLISCFGFNAQQIEAKENIHDNFVAYAASEYQYISYPSDFFNHAASQENWQYSFQRLFPTLYKFSLNTHLSNCRSGLHRSVSINSFVVKTENHIMRFEGIDIIHPFNYFW